MYLTHTYRYISRRHVAAAFLFAFAAVAAAALLFAAAFSDNTADAAFAMPAGLSDGDLMRGPDGIKVWIVNQHGFRRHVFNPAVFSMYGHLRWEHIKSVDQATLDMFTASDLYRVAGDYRVWSMGEVSEAQGVAFKYWLDMSPETFASEGYRWEEVFTVNEAERNYYQDGGPVISRKPDAALATFASCPELEEVLQNNKERLGSYGYVTFDGFTLERAVPFAAPTPEATAEAPEVVQDYSRTNVQVQGVDEADIVKTDGAYVYTINRNRVLITKATPPEDAQVVATISFGESAPTELFIHENMLLVFGQRVSFYAPEYVAGKPQVLLSHLGILPVSSLSFIELYDISDRANPQRARTIEFDASYLSSRKIGNMVYAVFNSYPDYRYFEPAFLEEGTDPADSALFLPRYRATLGASPIPDAEPLTSLVGCEDVGYIPPVIQNQYLTVIGLAMDDPQASFSKEVVLGAGTEVYASPTNLYVANTHYNFFPLPLVPVDEEAEENAPPEEETVVQKFALHEGVVAYQGEARVPGVVLNQFSMDEHEGYFRIATTINSFFGAADSQRNAVFVLDGALKKTGAIDMIAPGEQLYSARFLGARGYLVTFQTIDPFFVLDLSDPAHPAILGELKIPGYSNYLHPYDENHIIGVGKNAVGDESGGFAWYQGMKLALFDVTDPVNPVSMHSFDIGDRGTYSAALDDHRAFLFSREKNLLVLPIYLAEIPEDQKQATEDPFTYGEYAFQGSYVFSLTPENGFALRGRITHIEDPETQIFGDYDIARNLYIGDDLYSLSGAKMGINDLSDLHETGEVMFP